MPTQLGSTSILDNHKPQDSYNHVMGEQGDTCSQCHERTLRESGCATREGEEVESG